MEHLKHIALLRGINVGGHHKVPMAELRKEMEKLGFSKVVTLLNSGNIIFETQKTANLEEKIEAHLQKKLGFHIPVVVRNFEELAAVVKNNPFKHINSDQNTKHYLTFLKNEPKNILSLPYLSKDESFQIIHIAYKTVFSVIDISKGKTVKGMEELEKLFGKEITTRN